MNRFIRTGFTPIVQHYQDLPTYCPDTKSTNQPIYTCWWQGYSAAPELVKTCLDSIQKNAGDHPVHIITQDNWQDYVQLPSSIIDKVRAGQISLTHLSDIFRMSLIAAGGGLWLDATVFVTQPIPESCFTSSLYTIHYNESRSPITLGRWTGYCMGAPAHSPLHCFCRDVFFKYWDKYSVLLEYFFIDYLIAFAYDTITSIQNQIDLVPFNNSAVMELDRISNEPYSPIVFNSVYESALFFKLNWKRGYHFYIGDKLTNYGYLMTL